MGYSLNAVQAEAVLQALKQNYSVYAPKRFPKQGRYSDTDVIKYAEVEHYEDIVRSQLPRLIDRGRIIAWNFTIKTVYREQVIGIRVTLCSLLNV